MRAYSCRCSEEQLLSLRQKVVSLFQEKYPDFYGTEFINLDFHSIPHYGDESEMEKVWCGAKGKRMKGALTLFAQDGESKLILYTDADIRRASRMIRLWSSFILEEHTKGSKADVGI